MIPDIGLIALIIAFGMSVYATLISVNGGMVTAACTGWPALVMPSWPFLPC